MPSPGNKDVTAFVRAEIIKLRGPEEKPLTSWDALAKHLGLAKPQIYGIWEQKKSAGPKVEQVFAERLFNGSLDALHAAAKAHVAIHGNGTVPSQPTFVSLRPSTSNNAETALNVYAWDPRMSFEDKVMVASRVSTTHSKSSVDPGISAWTDEIRRYERELLGTAKTVHDRTEPAPMDDGGSPEAKAARAARDEKRAKK